MFTKEDLKSVFPYAKEEVLDTILDSDELFNQYKINHNYLRMCHFLAQAGWETDGFTNLQEKQASVNYYKRYDNRKDLGNIYPGDGYRYKGRGYFHLTGRFNYKSYGKQLGLDFINKPELVEDPKVGLMTALLYWDNNKLNALADKNDIIRITKRINGGMNGFDGRKKLFDKLYSKI